MVRKVMFICAHNQTRSVAGEGLLTGEEGFEVRSRAAWRGTTRKVRKVDCDWADEIYVMMPGMAVPVAEQGCPKEKIRSLWIPDTYGSCEDKLLLELKKQLKPFGIHVKKTLEQAQEDCWTITQRKMGYGGKYPELFWSWEPSEEEIVEARMYGVKPEDVRALAEWEEEERGGAPRKEEMDEAELEAEEQYPYVPMWHIEEGERRRREKGAFERREREAEEVREVLKAEEKSMQEKLAEFEVAEKYVQAKRGERERMKQKLKGEKKLLDELERYTRSIKKLFER